MTDSPQLQRVRDARAAMLLTHPFFGVLSLKLKLVVTRDIPTAAVTNTEMLWNPDFVDTLSGAEIKGTAAHEVMHLALCHHARHGNRHPVIWNIACDYAINPLLVEDGLSLPPNVCLNDKYKNMSAEAIYEDLMKNAKVVQVGGGGADCGVNPQGWGDFETSRPEGSAENSESAREWSQNAADALRAAKSAGKMPANITRQIEEALAPRADWKSLLRRFMTDQVRVTPTWSKPNKRLYPGVYIPGKLKDGMGAVAIMVDTSGSIDAHTLSVFAAEINCIIEDCAPARVYVIYCDAAVNGVAEFECGEPVTLRPHGGGGTDFRPPFKRVEREGWELAACVYLTDLCGAFPDSAPGYPVLWASYGAGDTRAPWGETVKIDA